MPSSPAIHPTDSPASPKSPARTAAKLRDKLPSFDRVLDKLPSFTSSQNSSRHRTSSSQESLDEMVTQMDTAHGNSWHNRVRLKFALVFLVASLALGFLAASALSPCTEAQFLLAFLNGFCSMLFVNMGFRQALLDDHIALSSHAPLFLPSWHLSVSIIALCCVLDGLVYVLYKHTDDAAMAGYCGMEHTFAEAYEESRINVPSLVANVLKTIITIGSYEMWYRYLPKFEQIFHQREEDRCSNSRQNSGRSIVDSGADSEGDYAGADYAVDSSRSVVSSSRPSFWGGGESLTIEEYTHKHRSTSIHRVFVSFALLAGVVTVACDVAVLQRSWIWVVFGLSFVALVFSNFILDGSYNRRRQQLLEVRHSPGYLYMAMGTIIVAVNVLAFVRNGTATLYGPVAACASITFASFLILFVWESITKKAVTRFDNGPLFLPMMFVTDLTNVYLYTVVRFQSWEFVGLIVVGEGISLAKNCGLGKIVIWGCKKFVGVTHNNKFPLDSNTHLEELVTYSAVDTISELLAVGAMAGMVVGFELGRAGGGTGEETLLTCVFDVNAGEEGRLCLEAAVDQEELSPTTESPHTLPDKLLSLTFVVACRVLFFGLERLLFKRFVMHNIDSGKVLAKVFRGSFGYMCISCIYIVVLSLSSGLRILDIENSKLQWERNGDNCTGEIW